jgi:hypothetical protein
MHTRNKIKSIIILIAISIISSCAEKDVRSLVIECSKEDDLAKGLKIFAQIKKMGVDSQTLLDTFHATQIVKEKAKILDIAFTLNDPIAIYMMSEFSWSSLNKKKINSILLIERGEKVKELEQAIGVQLDSLLDSPDLNSLKNSEFMKSYK